MANKLKKKMTKKNALKKQNAKIGDNIDNESFVVEGLEDSMTSSDDDELKDEVPELFEDRAKNREAVLKTLEWTEEDIDPKVDKEGAMRQKRRKDKFMEKKMRILRALPKVPLRPFQAPPVFIDMTGDAMYELKWNPILPVNSSKKKLTKEEILA